VWPSAGRWETTGPLGKSVSSRLYGVTAGPVPVGSVLIFFASDACQQERVEVVGLSLPAGLVPADVFLQGA
jgi:hypothetical protein